jgi:hypothetical protein
MSDAMSRCEHCGHESGVFVCDDCQYAKEQFTSAVLDLLILINVDPDSRIMVMIDLAGYLEGGVTTPPPGIP